MEEDIGGPSKGLDMMGKGDLEWWHTPLIPELRSQSQ